MRLQFPPGEDLSMGCSNVLRMSLTAGSRVGPCHMPTFIIHLRTANYLKRIFLAILWQRVWTRHEDGSIL
uniref:Uncharacterized protein n=1 Tax=Arundo donax TaxID=35708 RepID=A0A0A9G5M0_ARUDO